MKLTFSILAPIVLALFISAPTFAQSPPHVSSTSSPAPAAAPNLVNLTDLLSVAGPFSTFLNYCIQTNVIETFQNQANDTKTGITIFVPKNSAFSTLKAATFSNLTQDQLKSLLLYHALPKHHSFNEFINSRILNPVSTFAGNQFTLNVTRSKGTIKVKSMWSYPTIRSCVYTHQPVAVYELDKVLLPSQLFSTDPTLATSPESKPFDLAPGASMVGSKTKSTGSGYGVIASLLVAFGQFVGIPLKQV